MLARATDPVLAEVGQDGGLVSALLVYALEKDMIDAALVSYLEGDGTTWKAIPGVARTKEEVIASAGSRYTYSANTMAYADAIEGGAERIALVGMSCQSSVPPVMKQRKAGKVARRLSLNIGLLCSKTFDDAIFEELFEAKYGLKKSEMKKMNIKGVFQIWMKNGDYHEVPLKECHAWTREGCKMCPDFAAEHADISTGGIGKFNDWTLTIVRTDDRARAHGRHDPRRMDRDPPRRRRPGAIALDAQALGEVAQALARVRRRRAAAPARCRLLRSRGSAMPDRRHIRIPVLGKAAPPIGSDFVSLEAASGIVLLLAAIGAHRVGQRRHHRVRELVGPRTHHRPRRPRDHRVAGALGERRAHDHLLLRRRARDQARAGHRASCATAAAPRCRRSPRSAAWWCPALLYVAINAGGRRSRRLGHPHGHRHRVRRRRARAARGRVCRAA